MRKVWYVQERLGGKYLYLQKVPLCFLKNKQKYLTDLAAADSVFKDWIWTGELRIRARFWLWLKKASEIKIW